MHSKPVLAFLGILLLVFAWSVLGLLRKMILTVENKKIAESKLIQLEQEKVQLSSDIDKLSTEKGKEETIREKFPVAKEGEGVVIIVDDKSTTEAPPKPSGGFFSFFTNWFK